MAYVRRLAIQLHSQGVKAAAVDLGELWCCVAVTACRVVVQASTHRKAHADT